MANSNSSKPHYQSMGLEWAQIDEHREALFALFLEVKDGQEPVVKTVAVAIPNISGRGEPGQSFYAIRSLCPMADTSLDIPKAPQSEPVLPPKFTEGAPGLTIVRQTVDKDATAGVPGRSDTTRNKS